MRFAMFCLVMFLLPEGGAAGESAAGKSGISPAEIHNRIEEVKRYFSAYRFDQARRLCRKMLERGIVDDSLHEEVLFWEARAAFELAGHDRKKLQAAIEIFRKISENLLLNEHQHRDKDALFWIGRAYLRAGNPKAASAVFSRLSGLGSQAGLDADYRWYWARALRMQADGLSSEGKSAQQVIQERKKLWLSAKQKLLQIALVYENSSHYQDAEIALIQLDMQLGEYRDAEIRAGDLLQKHGLAGKTRRNAMLYRARCAYLVGDFDRAVRFYGSFLAEDGLGRQMRLEGLYELGRCLYQVARGAGGLQARDYLVRARRRLQQALQLMGSDNARRLPGIHVYCQILVELGENKAAIDLMGPILNDAAWADQAHYLAGRACRGLGRLDSAIRYFSACLARTRMLGPTEFVMDVLRNLAELEEKRKDFASAFLYYRQTGMVARVLRNQAVMAAADMGLARSLVGLGRRNRSEGDIAAAPMAAACLRLLIAGGTREIDPFSALDEFDFQVRRMRLQADKGIRIYDSALAILEKLQQRYQDRVRQDELAFEQGMALFLKAETMARAALSGGRLDMGGLTRIVKLYEQAAERMAVAGQVNPRGSWAPGSNFQLGRIHASRGRFSFKVAEILELTGRRTEAGNYREEGKKVLGWARSPFRLAIKTAGADVDLRTAARMDLGQTYFELEEFSKAAREFQLLADDPEIHESTRAAATRMWARALDRLGMTDEAITRLRPDVGRYLASAILEGQLLEKQGHPRDAYNSYRAVFRANRASVPANDTPGLAAEAAFRAWSLALAQAEAIAGSDGDAEAVRNTAVRELEKTAAEHLASEWSARALFTLGDYLLGREQGWRRVRKIARKYAALALARLEQAKAVSNDEKRDLAGLLQAMYLLEGKALLAGNQSRAAALVLERADMGDGKSPEQRTRTALALMELGNAAMLQKDENAAIRFYADVFARFDDVVAVADSARITLAKIYARRAREAFAAAAANKDPKAARPVLETAQTWLRRAREVLEHGHDRGRMLQEQRKLERLEQSP